jgi:polysaccharide deacetylase 2 family uncharacterized protein YibQ
MKRTRKYHHSPAHRISVTFLFLAAIGVLLYLTLAVWPRGSSAMYTPSPTGTTHDQDVTSHVIQPQPEPGAGGSSGAVTVLPKGGRIVVIIDDAGNDLSPLQRFLEFPGPLTIAVLPQLPYSTEAARRAHAAGKEVMLHLPLEPLGNENPGPGALEVSFDRYRIRETLERDFKTVPFARGVNNHMGSKATQDPMVMDALFAYLNDKNLYFVDSRTTAASLGKEYAGRYGVNMTERTYFLDNAPVKSEVTRVLNEGVAYARAKGAALLIGHVQNTVVIDVLKELYEELTAAGMEFVTVSSYLRPAGRGQ